MNDRTPCAVPGCRGWRSRERIGMDNSYLCARHFGPVDLSLKRLRASMRRRHGNGNYGCRIDSWIWRRMVRQAIERAAGL